MTMNRRSFLTRSSAAAFVSLVGFEALAQRGCAGPPAGVQLYTVRDALGRDPRAALTQLREIGIVEAELYGLNGAANATLFGMPASDLKKACEANGIRLPATHIGGDLTNHAEIAEIARALGVEAVIVALPSEFSGQVDGRFAMVPAKSRAQLDTLAEKLNRAGREYRDRGLTFGYHNHHIEFMPVDNVVPYDYLLSNTDPGLVRIELDIGWLATAGADPVAYLRKHAGRVLSCHLKDYNPTIVSDVPQRKVVAPGAGRVDFGAVLAAMRETGVAHGYIEVDVSDDPFGDVRRGHAHLRKLQGCA
ncbi:MAG TPA: sugar phosphate isomerase/epimerase [Gammaproteobacteria bacterium]|nr:sugar phosphate isomerase/epimerase [Gammaproteobacteria bacterium]